MYLKGFRFQSTVMKSLLAFTSPPEGRNDRYYHPHFTEEGKLRARLFKVSVVTTTVWYA